LVLVFLQLRQSVETTLKILLEFKFFQICQFFLIVLTKIHISSENVRAIFLEFRYFPEIMTLLMLIQFLDGALQLIFVSWKQENGSNFSNTLKFEMEISYSRF
jgi:hypothetical protein